MGGWHCFRCPIRSRGSERRSGFEHIGFDELTETLRGRVLCLESGVKIGESGELPGLGFRV
jgi:hypothetical protein